MQCIPTNFKQPLCKKKHASPSLCPKVVKRHHFCFWKLDHYLLSISWQFDLKLCFQSRLSSTEKTCQIASHSWRLMRSWKDWGICLFAFVHITWQVRLYRVIDKLGMEKKGDWWELDLVLRVYLLFGGHMTLMSLSHRDFFLLISNSSFHLVLFCFFIRISWFLLLYTCVSILCCYWIELTDMKEKSKKKKRK